MTVEPFDDSIRAGGVLPPREYIVPPPPPKQNQTPKFQTPTPQAPTPTQRPKPQTQNTQTPNNQTLKEQKFHTPNLKSSNAQTTNRRLQNQNTKRTSRHGEESGALADDDASDDEEVNWASRLRVERAWVWHTGFATGSFRPISGKSFHAILFC